MYLMNVNSGTVQTREEWKQDFLSMPLHEWHGYADEEDFKADFLHDDLVASWDFCLEEVRENEHGDWESVK